MAERIYLVFEIMAVFIFLYGLYGVKFDLNFHLVLCISIELILCYITEIYGQFVYSRIITCMILLVYAKAEFKGIWRRTIINFILCLIAVSAIQLARYFPSLFWHSDAVECAGYMIHIPLFLFLLFLYKKEILNKIALYMQQKSKIVTMYFLLAGLLGIYVLYTLRKTRQLDPFTYFLTIFVVIFLLIVLLQLQKVKYINQQIEMKEELNELYGDAMAELVDRLRVNQHNYKNQLNAIRGMIFSADNLEELRQEQEEYYQRILRENECSNILSGNNDPLIAGFLYSKFLSIDSNRTEVKHSLKINRIKNSLMASDVIKVLGVLIDNAVEEVEKDCYTHKGIEIKLYENKKLILEVGNVCGFVKSERAAEFFRKGTSSKGENRGLGLYSVKEIADKWQGEITVSNRDRNGENWFYITVELSNC